MKKKKAMDDCSISEEGLAELKQICNEYRTVVTKRIAKRTEAKYKQMNQNKIDALNRHILRLQRENARVKQAAAEAREETAKVELRVRQELAMPGPSASGDAKPMVGPVRKLGISIKCKNCDSTFDDPQAFGPHITECQKPFECPLCHRFYRQQQSLIRHVYTHAE